MGKQQILEGMIGLEIHTYLVTKEKLFCKCKSSREKGQKENIYVCPICTGQPGAKPMMPNEEAVKQAVRIGLMLNCKINNQLIWKRKHYSWPDLPKGYQNTLSGAGAIPVGENGNFLGIKIGSMHLEEDPASWNPKSGEVDYNRSGLPLVEIVTEPDFSTAEEVIDWLKKLTLSLSYLKAVDSNAGIKVDVNVSIPKKSERVEVKNLSSIESIGKAINYELERQMNESCKQKETRRYDDSKGKTILMRSKEDAEDYRFISDPDLKSINIDKKYIQELEESMPEGPEEKLSKLIKKYKIDKKNAEILSKNIDIVEFFEKVAESVGADFALSWVSIELLRFLNYNKKKLHEVEIDLEHFVELLNLVKSDKITPLKGKEMLNKFYPKSFMPKIEGEKISDEKELEKIIKIVISKNSKAVSDYKNGEKNAFNFLMGEIMKESKKMADFVVARKVLERMLK
jgi:aspartyl-tRNA(Asn)/glutamyl-tRNA(Gln) amidotransferase subunit B